MPNMELRLTGSGGQGVILATVILADAALQSGKNVAQSQAYGPEARGGMCKAEVLVSDDVIGFTKVQNPTFLMALTQASLEHFASGVDEDCIILMDSSLDISKVDTKSKKIYKAPILDAAKNVVGKAFTANIVAVSVINKILGLSTPETLQEVVANYIPKGTEAINFKALDAGREVKVEEA